ncbi:MAG: ABC transporter permease subunit [Anaerolineales bacterium]|jgi:ABC-type transport system involved in multi-copper enzyme maturation permease subunit|nr:ABC transporter permease subunit [Anaerolineales bacterium]WKZ40928.1 MAG: ABC transporter permease subunit [Anaerolineales bacterium]
MNWRSIWAIAKKDLKEVRQNKAAWGPGIAVPLIFAILMPLIFIILPQVIPVEDVERELGDINVMLRSMPPAMQALFEGRSLEQMFVLYMAGFTLAPLFLIMPLMFSTVIGSDSFVGERERKTMEALLYAPTSDMELFLGKVLAAVIPAIGLSWITYLMYIIVVNVASYPLFGEVWFPLPTWYPLMLWMTPALAVLGISATVLISSRVRTFMEAYQMSASLVVLVLALVIGQVTGVLFLGVGTALAIGAVIWLVDAALIYISVKKFKRSSLIAKL